jgi:phosphoribosylaminoimidazolecarboxamide formyltransferase/IMP cyclohydrolase
MGEASEHGIEMLDMVVVNLYPFQQTIAKPGITPEEAVEQIDIGGPALLRAAAKNHHYTAAICNPEFYENIIAGMRASDGMISYESLQVLAMEAYLHTCQYDAAIAQYIGTTGFLENRKGRMPLILTPCYTKRGSDLRYGENPHQAGALYKLAGSPPGLAEAKVLYAGKEVSFNNYLDMAAAIRAAYLFDEPTAAIIKHQNPCGLSTAGCLVDAYVNAWVADPISAFGGIIAFNGIVTEEVASLIGNKDTLRDLVEPVYRSQTGDSQSEIISAFPECVIAPGFTDEALDLLKNRKSIRVLEISGDTLAACLSELEIRQIPGGAVAQTPDVEFVDPTKLKIVTDVQPTEAELASLIFADRVARMVKSNAIVLAQGTNVVGCGAGQMSRVESCIIASRKAGLRAEGSVLASDAMFPAVDGLIAAADTGCSAIIQPGGSQKDEEVIAAANERGIAMVFTGMRHFYH